MDQEFGSWGCILKWKVQYTLCSMHACYMYIRCTWLLTKLHHTVFFRTFCKEKQTRNHDTCGYVHFRQTSFSLCFSQLPRNVPRTGNEQRTLQSQTYHSPKLDVSGLQSLQSYTYMYLVHNTCYIPREHVVCLQSSTQGHIVVTLTSNLGE